MSIDNQDNDPEISSGVLKICASYLSTSADYVEQISLAGIGKNQYIVAKDLRQIATFLRDKSDTRKVEDISGIDQWEGDGGS